MKDLSKPGDFIVNGFNYFDTDYYLNTYAEVKKERLDALEDYLTIGWKEGRNPNPLFDVNYYLESNLDVNAAGLEPLYHYLKYGWKEGRNPNPLFDIAYYYECNPEVKEAAIEPLYHYLVHGWKKGRNPGPLFNVTFYLSSNPDVKEALIEPLYHYLVHGRHEGRDPKPIPIVQEINTLPVHNHVVNEKSEDKSTEELLIANSEYFDAKWYATNYKLDITQDPAKHYLYKGWKELYNPSERFSTIQYIILNNDVEASGMNPLLHYELHGRSEQNRIYYEPYVIDHVLNNEYKRKQDDFIRSTYNRHAKKLIVYLVPEVDIIGGGVMSICSMARVTSSIKELSDYTILVATTPSVTTFFQFTKFEAGFNILRFDQLREYFTELEEIIIHMPEIYVFYFLLKMNPKDADWLRRLKKTQLNILNQNMGLMPRPKVVTYLKVFGYTTMTCAHKRYCTKQLRSAYDIPVHFFSTSNMVKYKYRSYEEKEDIIAYSPDGNPFKEDILSLLKNAFPGYKFIEIQNMSYQQYLDTITKAKWMITFGEGIDGYFMESIRSGAISFSVKNYLFFDEEYDGYLNIYDSYFDMLSKLVTDMKKLDNEKKYNSFNSTLRALDSKIYNDAEYKNNIKEYYLGNYNFPNKDVLAERVKRMNRKPLISIVVATYNGDKYLAKQLDSLISQTYSNFEIIVSDDSSTDKTQTILENYSKKHGIKVLPNKKGKGLVGNFSNGLLAAKGEYIALCDQDDIWELNKLEVLLERIDDFDIVQGQMVIIDDNDAYHPAKYMHDAYEINKTSLYSIENYIKENPMLGCATLITKRCIDSSLPVPEGFVYHDWWIALTAILKGNGICNIDIPVVKYRQHDVNTAKSTFWSSEWCKKKYDSDSIILKEFSSKLNPTAKHLLECDMNLMLLYGFARKFAPKLAFDYFESNAIAFTDEVMKRLLESINTKAKEKVIYEK
jgi:glycosyltransferase involved in cell wall biosynthesis